MNKNALKTLDSARKLLGMTATPYKNIQLLDEKVSGLKKVSKKDGPFTVIALKGKKVVDQFRGAEHKELKDVITMMKSAHKGANISVEAKGGKIVHTESVELGEKTAPMYFEFPDERKAKQFEYDISNSGVAIGKITGKKVEVTLLRGGSGAMAHRAISKYMKKNKGKIIKESVELDEKVMGASYPGGHPMRKFSVPASPEIKKHIESGKAKILKKVPSVLGPTTKFVVIPNPEYRNAKVSGQDKVLMATISDPKRGRIKMFAFHGSHVSLAKAMQFAINNKLVTTTKMESVELDEAWTADSVIKNAEIGSKKGYGITIKKTGGITKTPHKHMLMTMRRDKSVRVTFDHGKDEFEGTPQSVALYINKKLGIKESVELDEALTLASDDLSAVKKTAQRLAKSHLDRTYYVVQNTKIRGDGKMKRYEVVDSVDMHMYRNEKKIIGYGKSVKESVDEKLKLSRQLKNPKTEVLVSNKKGKTITIDRKDLKTYERKGWSLAEEMSAAQMKKLGITNPLKGKKYPYQNEEDQMKESTLLQRALRLAPLAEAKSVPLVRTGQGSYTKDTHPKRKDGKIERMYQANNEKEFTAIKDTATELFRAKKGVNSVVGKGKKKELTVVFDNDKVRKEFEKKMRIKESAKLDSVDKDELKGKHKHRDDKDIDNDGDVDSSDKFLHKRRKAITKAVAKEETGDKAEYKKFFQSALKKFGVTQPDQLDGEKKKAFYNYVDKNWKSDKEKETGKDDPS